MLDKTSAEYKKVIRLYKQGKISEEDCLKLLDALEHYEDDYDYEDEGNVDEAKQEERAEKNIGKLIKDLGIKIATTVKSGLDTANKAAEAASDKLRGYVRRAAQGFADSLADPEGEANTEEEPEKDNDGICDGECQPEHYPVPYKKLIIKVYYINGKAYSLSCKTGKKEKLKDKCEKFMSTAAYVKLLSLLDKNFVGKYELSFGEEFIRITVRPKNQ